MKKKLFIFPVFLLALALLFASSCSLKEEAPALTESPTNTLSETVPGAAAEAAETGEAQTDGDPARTLAEPIAKQVRARGIDISRWQGDVNWQELKESGEADFVMIRLGSRPADGLRYPDSMAEKNLYGAQSAGIPAGVYFYAVPTSPDDSREDARYVLEKIASFRIACPVAYDIEAGLDGTSLTAAERTACMNAFTREIDAAGYEAMLYAPYEEIENPGIWDRANLTGCKIWVARYEAPVWSEAEFPDGNDSYDAWQYSNTGSVPGIEGNVDLDVFYFPVYRSPV